MKKIHPSELNKLILPYVKEDKLNNTEIARKLNIKNSNGSYDITRIKEIRNWPDFFIKEKIGKIKTYSFTLFTYSEHDLSLSVRCVIKEDGTFNNKGKIIKKRLSKIKQYYIPVKVRKFRTEQRQRMLDKGYSIEQLPKHLQKIIRQTHI